MATHIKKDIHKYKQHPCFEKPKKIERKLITRALRHYLKIEATKHDNNS